MKYIKLGFVQQLLAMKLLHILIWGQPAQYPYLVSPKSSAFCTVSWGLSVADYPKSLC
jgi:hypothetical protein